MGEEQIKTEIIPFLDGFFQAEYDNTVSAYSPEISQEEHGEKAEEYLDKYLLDSLSLLFYDWHSKFDVEESKREKILKEGLKKRKIFAVEEYPSPKFNYLLEDTVSGPVYAAYTGGEVPHMADFITLRYFVGDVDGEWKIFTFQDPEGYPKKLIWEAYADDEAPDEPTIEKLGKRSAIVKLDEPAYPEHKKYVEQL